ncbi:TolC family protein [Novosphingobium sp. 9]|uniref:TolC family protein n=1 Tax=Novosphingobium sp. 9 TaxID=2025349 RepID=UPI0021B5266C|nr:TolC family protein [Novosphingobium sp. 9]
MMKRTGLNLVPTVTLCAVMSGALGACAVGPNYHARAAADLGVPDAWSVPASTEREDLTRWWSRFDDPVLTQVVELAAANNLDLAQAVARLRQAREALKVSQGSLFPTLSGSAGATRYEQVRGPTARRPPVPRAMSIRAAGDDQLFGRPRCQLSA